jgi:DNA-binding NarL/FixJ family response regulator
VVLITNIRFYREGLAAALNRAPGLKVVGQSCSWREALAVLRDERPQVVLLDASASEAPAAIHAITPSGRRAAGVRRRPAKSAAARSTG